MNRWIGGAGVLALLLCFSAAADAAQPADQTATSRKTAGKTKLRQTHVKPKRVQSTVKKPDTSSSKKTLAAQQRARARAEREANAAAGQAAPGASKP